MPALPIPQYGIEKLFLFPCYGTPEAYKAATGKDAPAWDPTKPPKYWEDPAAKAGTRRTVVYDRALVLDDRGFFMADANGNPLIDLLPLPKDEAATVNIPPNTANVPGATVPQTPPPLRALDPNEELVFGFGNVPVVRNKTLFDTLTNGFTVNDRALLRSIAAKLGL